MKVKNLLMNNILLLLLLCACKVNGTAYSPTATTEIEMSQTATKDVFIPTPTIAVADTPTATEIVTPSFVPTDMPKLRPGFTIIPVRFAESRKGLEELPQAISYRSQDSERTTLKIIQKDFQIVDLSDSFELIYGTRWAPDGKKIFITGYSRQAEKFQYWVLDIDKQTQTQILTDGAISQVIDFSWAPDSERYALISQDGLLYVGHISEDSPTMIYFSPKADLTEVVWSPVSDMIGFIEYEAPTISHAYIIKPDGSTSLQLTYGEEENIELAWSPDGTQLSVMRHTPSEPWTIYVINANLSGEEKVVIGIESVSHPTWSPDGKEFIYLRWVSDLMTLGEILIYPCMLSIENEQEICYGIDSQLLTPVWSQDPSILLFHIDNTLWVLDRDSNTAYPIVTEEDIRNFNWVNSNER